MKTNNEQYDYIRCSIDDLQRKLYDHKGAGMVTIVAETVPEMRKTNNPFRNQKVIKRAVVNGVINWIYANAVNRQRVRESKAPDFLPDERCWGERERRTPFVQYKGKRYLELKVQRVLETQFFVDDKPVAESDLLPWLVRPSEPVRQELDAPVVLRDYKLENVKEINMDGERLRIL